MISFTVLGKPQPAGSKRAFPNPKTGGVIVTDAAKNSRPWKREVAAAAHETHDGPLLTGPLRLEVFFYFARPKGHFGTGRNAAFLKDSAPECVTVRPDVTKLLRAVEDALTGVVWRDDAQVVRQVAAKMYGEPERCEVTVRSLELARD